MIFAIWGPPGSSFGGFGDSLGGSWSLLGPLGETLEAPWRPLGDLLGALGAFLAPLLEVPGAFWELWGVPWAHFGSSQDPF